jgi:uncharacterized protein
MDYISRNMAKKLENTVKTFSTVYLNGARQCGKSTLVRHITPSDSVNYITFDTNAIMLAAKKDEIQQVPELFFKLKKYVDDKRFESDGKALFIMTGSASILTLPELAQSMAGRMAVLTLYPFSAAEMHNTDANFINRIWNDDFSIKKL